MSANLRLPTEVDLLVIGGGITGAGIALEAARGLPAGSRVLLVEARDFAWGTSSRSSKLVHGGLRYLKEGKPLLTLESVRERNRLMREAPGLVAPIGFLMAHYQGGSPSRAAMRVGLGLYDAFAGRRTSGFADPAEAQRCAPGLASDGLEGASLYLDATTDDARLVLRVLHEATRAGATVANYQTASELLRDAQGRVCGARLTDTDTGAQSEIRAGCVIAATGVWADRLRGQLGHAPKLRPLRGSHLMLPAWRLPLARAVAFLHPADRRPVFAYPWQGATLVGTTDLDHRDLDHEPAISNQEVDYLLAALNHQFPDLLTQREDILSTWAGVRPVLDSGKGLAPSQESRDHIVLHEEGLISVTGGKLTTFRLIARDALRRAGLANWKAPQDDSILPLPHLRDSERLPVRQRQRLITSLGDAAQQLIDEHGDAELSEIPGSHVLWAELWHALRHEQVRHLDDLLLRRTRIGLAQRDGAAHLLPALHERVCAELGWDVPRWDAECARYRDLIARCYSVPKVGAGNTAQTPEIAA